MKPRRMAGVAAPTLMHNTGFSLNPDIWYAATTIAARRAWMASDTQSPGDLIRAASSSGSRRSNNPASAPAIPPNAPKTNPAVNTGYLVDPAKDARVSARISRAVRGRERSV